MSGLSHQNREGWQLWDRAHKSGKTRVVRMATKVKGRPYFLCPKPLIDLIFPGTRHLKLFLSSHRESILLHYNRVRRP